MSGQKLGAMIVAVAVCLGLLVAVFILPVIQPAARESRAALDEAAERAARRLAVVSRTVERAVAVDRLQAQGASAPSDEDLTQVMARNPNLLQPTQEVVQRYKQIFQAADAAYHQITGDAPSVPEGIQPPASETAQIAWLRQSFGKAEQTVQETLQAVDAAIGELRSAISAAATEGFTGNDHFGANFVMGGLQYQKAALLYNLAGNRLNQAMQLQARIVAQLQQHANVAGQAQAIQGRLQEISLADRAAQAAQPEAAAVPAPRQPQSVMERAVEAIERAEGIPSPQPSPEPAQPAAEPAVPQVALGEAQAPAEVAAAHARQIEQQIAEVQEQIAAIEQQMAGPQQQLEQARQQLAQFEQQLQELDKQGQVLPDVEAARQYRQTYMQVSQQVRELEARIHALETGTMAGAQLSPETDDYLTGRYEGGEVQVGLNTLQRRLEEQQNILAILQQAQKEMQDLAATLERDSQGRQQFAQTLSGQAQQAQARLTELHAQLAELMEQVGQYEQQALTAAEAAAQAFNTAGQAARKTASEAQQGLAAVPPEKPNRRLEALSVYESPTAAAERGLVNTYMLQAQIHLHQALALKAQRGVLEMLQGAGVREVDVAAVDQQINDGIRQALAALYTPEGSNHAMAHAERFAQALSRQRFVPLSPTSSTKVTMPNWLGPALRGVVLTMLAEVQKAAGQDGLAENTRNEAAAALNQAIGNNQNSELLQPYVHLLASLQPQGAQTPAPVQTTPPAMPAP